jgi:hypothetical protein
VLNAQRPPAPVVQSASDAQVSLLVLQYQPLGGAPSKQP